MSGGRGLAVVRGRAWLAEGVSDAIASHTTKRSEGVHPESSSVHSVLIAVSAHNECIRDERTVTTPRHRFRGCLAHTLPSPPCELVHFRGAEKARL